jgi:hypothetical protein
MCTGSRRERGSASCLSAGALRLDEAVAAEVLAALQPVGIEAAFQAEEQLTQHNDQKRTSLTLALERAQFEVRRRSIKGVRLVRYYSNTLLPIPNT